MACPGRNHLFGIDGMQIELDQCIDKPLFKWRCRSARRALDLVPDVCLSSGRAIRSPYIIPHRPVSTTNRKNSDRDEDQELLSHIDRIRVGRELSKRRELILDIIQLLGLQRIKQLYQIL